MPMSLSGLSPYLSDFVWHLSTWFSFYLPAANCLSYGEALCLCLSFNSYLLILVLSGCFYLCMPVHLAEILFFIAWPLVRRLGNFKICYLTTVTNDKSLTCQFAGCLLPVPPPPPAVVCPFRANHKSLTEKGLNFLFFYTLPYNYACLSFPKTRTKMGPECKQTTLPFLFGCPFTCSKKYNIFSVKLTLLIKVCV
jgi:hypothetical protein